VSRMSRVQAVVLPILREALPDVTVTSWGADIDYRKFPILNIRRVGGVRNMTKPMQLDKATIEMTAYTEVGLPETEQLYIDALEVLYDAVAQQKIMEAGYLHSIKETMGMTQFSSLYMDSWRVQGLIALGVRPLTQLTRSK
jgi:hypothetical protein